MGQSPYVYCDGDPVNNSDPSGHDVTQQQMDQQLGQDLDQEGQQLGQDNEQQFDQQMQQMEQQQQQQASQLGQQEINQQTEQQLGMSTGGPASGGSGKPSAGGGNIKITIPPQPKGYTGPNVLFDISGGGWDVQLGLRGGKPDQGILNIPLHIKGIGN